MAEPDWPLLPHSSSCPGAQTGILGSWGFAGLSPACWYIGTWLPEVPREPCTSVPMLVPQNWASDSPEAHGEEELAQTLLQLGLRGHICITGRCRSHLARLELIKRSSVPWPMVSVRRGTRPGCGSSPAALPKHPPVAGGVM